MGKGANKDLFQNAGTANTRSAQKAQSSDQLYGFLDPTLQQEATNPQGYSEADKNAMATASEQSLGGSVAGITGQANLAAARTRNAGGFQGAIGEGSREAQGKLSENALKVQVANANLKEQQKQTALSSLERLYGVDSATALNYLNASNTALGKTAPPPFNNAFAQTAGKNLANDANTVLMGPSGG